MPPNTLISVDLPAPLFAQEGHDLALPHGHGHVAQRSSAAELLADAVKLQAGICAVVQLRPLPARNHRTSRNNDFDNIARRRSPPC
jgi:hypothetical protein